MRKLFLFTGTWILFACCHAQMTLNYTIIEPNCYGDQNGEISVSVTGIIPPFQYQWSLSGATDTSHISGLAAGIYFLTVTQTDSNYVIIDTIVFNGHVPVMISLLPRNSSCSGKEDGKIITLATGGIAPYSYHWSTGNSSVNLDSLTEGNYKVTVTDSLGCPAYGETNIMTNNPISTIDSITNISCWGGRSGEMNITPLGGIRPYTFVWDMIDSIYTDTAHVQSIMDTVSAKTYTVTITDSAGCSVVKSYTLTQPGPLSIGYTHINNKCFDGYTGSASVWVLGGENGYNFHWSNNDIGATADSLKAGTYTVTVSDAHGCSVIQSVEIPQPFKGILVNADVIDVSCRDQHDGEINVSLVDNVLPPFTYNWSTGVTTNSISKLDGGNYMLTVTDANSCRSVDTFKVKITDIDCIEIFTCFSPNNDGVNDTWNIKNIQLYPNCKVSVLNQWNHLLLNSKGYQTPWDGKFNGEDMPASTYYYIITLGDSRYKPYTGSVTIIK